MYFTVSNDVISDNRNTLYMLADFSLLIEKPRPPVLPDGCPARTFHRLCRLPAMIEEVAKKLQGYFPDQESAMAMIRQQFEFNRFDELIKGRHKQDSIPSSVTPSSHRLCRIYGLC